MIAENELSNVIAESKNIKLDLNGKTLYHTNNNLIENNSTFEIVDSSEPKTGIIYSYTGYAVNNKAGKLTLSSGKIDSSSPDKGRSSYYPSGILNGNIATAEIRGMTICDVINNGIVNIYDGTINKGVTNNSTLNVLGGTLKGNDTILNQGVGTVNITSGTIYEITNKSTGDIRISGGTITNEIRNEAQNTTYISGGVINSRINGSGKDKYVISGGTINSYIMSYKELEMTNGTIEKIENDRYYKSTVKISGGTIGQIINESTGLITGGNIIQTGSNNAIVNSGTLEITGGSITSNNTAAINNSGTLTIGTNDDTVNIDTPYLEGKTYGVYNTGTFNFYDGEINGKSSIYGIVNNIPNGYQIYKKTTNEVEKAILKPEATDDAVASIGSINYKSLQDAINAPYVGESKTIKILRSTEVTENLIIPSGKNIILDLQGYTLSSSMENSIFTNNGTLTIIDTKENGKIINTSSVCIINNSVLNIGIDDGKVNENMLTITGSLSAIQNNGTLNKYDGTIN